MRFKQALATLLFQTALSFKAVFRVQPLDFFFCAFAAENGVAVWETAEAFDDVAVVIGEQQRLLHGRVGAHQPHAFVLVAELLAVHER